MRGVPAVAGQTFRLRPSKEFGRNIGTSNWPEDLLVDQHPRFWRSSGTPPSVPALRRRTVEPGRNWGCGRLGCSTACWITQPGSSQRLATPPPFPGTEPTLQAVAFRYQNTCNRTLSWDSRGQRTAGLAPYPGHRTGQPRRRVDSAAGAPGRRDVWARCRPGRRTTRCRAPACLPASPALAAITVYTTHNSNSEAPLAHLAQSSFNHGESRKGWRREELLSVSFTGLSVHEELRDRLVKLLLRQTRT